MREGLLLSQRFGNGVVGRRITIVLVLLWLRNVVLKSGSFKNPWRQEGTSRESEIEAVNTKK